MYFMNESQKGLHKFMENQNALTLDLQMVSCWNMEGIL